MEIRRQLVRGGSFLPLWESQGWKSGPRTQFQAPLDAEPLEVFFLSFSLNAVSDAFPVNASPLRAQACNSVFVEQANTWTDG